MPPSIWNFATARRWEYASAKQDMTVTAFAGLRIINTIRLLIWPMRAEQMGLAPSILCTTGSTAPPAGGRSTSHRSMSSVTWATRNGWRVSRSITFWTRAGSRATLQTDQFPGSSRRDSRQLSCWTWPHRKADGRRMVDSAYRERAQSPEADVRRRSMELL